MNNETWAEAKKTLAEKGVNFSKPIVDIRA